MKNRRIIIIGVIICILLIAILSILLSKVEENSGYLAYLSDIDNMPEEVVSPNFIHVIITKYKNFGGELDPTTISKATYNFSHNCVQQLHKLKECSEDEIYKYYENNIEYIKEEIGIGKDDFIQLVNKIKLLEGDELVYESSEFDTENVKVSSNFIVADLHIKYENNEELLIKVYLRKENSSTKSPIEFH